MVAAGCTSDDDWAGPPGADAAAGDEVVADSGATGESTGESTLDQVLVDELDATVRELMDELTVPGVVVLVDTPEGRWLEAFGTRTFDGDDPVTVDDHFRVGSNTKTMTGTVILQLADEGLISLDDPVSEYRDGVPEGDTVTIEHLLEMRSGLASYSTLDSFNRLMDEQPERVWQPEELLEVAFAEPMSFEPGTDYEYSNTNTVLLGLIAEDLTGMSLQENFEERIFGPLGLEDTHLPEVEDASIPDPHPRGYMWGTNASSNEDPALPEPEQSAALAGEIEPNDHTDDNPSWGWAAGAVISTAEDLATYVQALVEGGLLEPDTQQARLGSLQPTSDAPGAASYGWAIARLGNLLGHDGSLPGFQSVMGHDPDTDTTVIVLGNMQDSPDGRGVANEIARTLAQRLAAESG